MLVAHDVCHHCGSERVEWVGYTPRAAAQMRPSKDVQQCLSCKSMWYYAKSGKRLTVNKGMVYEKP